MDDLIKQGALAAKAGDINTARRLLAQAIKQSPNDERAWGWLYNVCKTDQERISCLKQMIRINPKNEKAAPLLDQLTSMDFPLELPPSQNTLDTLKEHQTSSELIHTNPADSFLEEKETIDRKAILEWTIANYLRVGYRVVTQTETSVQMVRPKQFDGCTAVVLLLIMVLPFIIYLLYYLTQKDETEYIVVDKQGNITATNENGVIRRFGSRDASQETNLQNAVHFVPAKNAVHFVPAKNDPGYSTSTKIALSIIALVTILSIFFAVFSVLTSH
jgi:hypothetical protein